MERISGVSLDEVIDTLTLEELGHIASILLCRVIENARVGPYRSFPKAPKYAFSSVEFLIHCREMLMLFCMEQYTESLLSRIPRNAAIQFTHGDLLPKNIIVQGSSITGIVD